MKKKIFNAVFLVTVFCLTMWAVFKGQDLNALLYYLSNAEASFIAASVVCVVAFILSESVIIHYLMRCLGVRTQFSHCCLYSFIGFFYCCITPSASGGQPMQVVYMRKDRIPVAVSTVVLAVITIVYKLVLVLIGTAVMVIRPAAVMPYLEPAEGIIWLGLVLNVICIAALLVLVFWPNLVRRLARWSMALIGKIRPFKNPEKQTARVERILSQYAGTSEFFRNHIPVVFNVFIITLVQRIILFFVTWLTYKAFSLSGHSMPAVVTLQAMISVAVDMLPLPGGMGISETLFLDIFRPVFGEALVLPGMVISRGISYYTQLLISAVMTVIATFIIKERKADKV